jgi:hypothetical protein
MIGRMSLGKITPILRIFDEAKAKEFYVGFLGFTVDRGSRDMSVKDPFGNRLTFTTAISSQRAGAQSGRVS